mmetsp:Transcript_77379/g.125539  ORF Transcript_77379/g.125539 Transcript_77379/m.125539 type:complete len:119 (+) Transcript_77379:100-456(+)
MCDITALCVFTIAVLHLKSTRCNIFMNYCNTTHRNIYMNSCNTLQCLHQFLQHAATSSRMTATHRNIFSPTHQPSAVADLAWHVTYEVAVCCNVLQWIAVCAAACEEAVTYDNAMPHR